MRSDGILRRHRGRSAQVMHRKRPFGAGAGVGHRSGQRLACLRLHDASVDERAAQPRARRLHGGARAGSLDVASVAQAEVRDLPWTAPRRKGIDPSNATFRQPGAARPLFHTRSRRARHRRRRRSTAPRRVTAPGRPKVQGSRGADCPCRHRRPQAGNRGKASLRDVMDGAQDINGKRILQREDAQRSLSS